MAIKIFNDYFHKGYSRELPPGHIYKQMYEQKIKSLFVPEGFQVTIYENADRSGKKSYPFYWGKYENLERYGVGEYPGMLHVEENGLGNHEFIEFGKMVWQRKGRTKITCW